MIPKTSSQTNSKSIVQELVRAFSTFLGKLEKMEGELENHLEGHTSFHDSLHPEYRLELPRATSTRSLNGDVFTTNNTFFVCK
jgi:hypothetical protein